MVHFTFIRGVKRLIHFNVPPFSGKEMDYMLRAVQNGKISGDGEFTRLCRAWLERRALGDAGSALLTTSCTHALEMCALLLDIQPGDEVIMPSFTFVSTADAFVLRGARIVFVDIRPDTMNIDETLIEPAITARTRAIVPVHYAGVGCEMDVICEIASRHGLAVVEDAAQGVMSAYRGKPLGSFGVFGCLSFHETKNYSMGEGGALLINNPEYLARAEIVREKGTNRSRFFRGEVDKYTWVEAGSSYLPSDLNAAYLWAQLEVAEEMLERRLGHWRRYAQALAPLAEAGRIALPQVPAHCTHNAHMFYIKLDDALQRQALIEHLKARGAQAVFHYVPLHSAPAGLRHGCFHGEDRHTTRESERLLRLPMYDSLRDEDIDTVVDGIRAFFA